MQEATGTKDSSGLRAKRLSSIILLSMKLIRVVFFFDLLHVRRLEYFKQQVHLVDGRRVRTLNSSTAIVLGGGRGKKLHVPSSNFGACLFVL